MRILIASGIFAPEAGGPATYAAALGSNLAQRGWNVDVVTYSQEARYDADTKYPFALTRIVRGNKFLNRFRFFITAYKLAKGADIIYTLDWFAAGLPVALTAKLRGVPYVVRVGGDYLWEQKYLESGAPPMPLKTFYERGLHRQLAYRPAYWLISFVLSHAALIVFNSDIQKELYERYYQLSPARCATVENPVPKFEQIKRERSSKEFVFWGRFIVMKNLDTLIRAFAQARIPKDYTLALIGGGPQKEKLEQLVRELGISDRVRFERGLPLEQVISRVKNARAFVLPSWTDISPNQVYEALSIELPSLVTKENYLSIREKLPDMIEPTSVDDVAAKLELLADDQEYTIFSSKFNSIQYVRSWDTVTEEHLAVFAGISGGMKG